MLAIRRFLLAAAAIVQLQATTPTEAVELRLLSIGAARPFLEQQIIPEFEKSTGHRVTAWWGPPNLIQSKLFQGEPVDVIFSGQSLWNEWVAAGKTGQGVEIARTGIGVGIRKGAPKPDLKDAETTRKFLLSVGSLAGLGFNTGTVGDRVLRVFQRVGITEEMLPKYRSYASGALAMQAVAKGEAEVALSVMPDVAHHSKDVDYGGAFPAEIQEYTIVSAAVATGSSHPHVAKAFLDFVIRSARPERLREKWLYPLQEN
jgi:molybdate transport system substrate-binding protein